MNNIFYISAAVAVISTLMVIVSLNPVHALLYLIVSLLSAAVIFYMIGAPFIAALEVIIYAGAIMVLFVFVVMMLNLGPQSVRQEREMSGRGQWFGPAALALVLLAELVYIVSAGGPSEAEGQAARISPKSIGLSLFGPYMIGVELASVLLLSGLIGAHHLGQRDRGED